MLKGGCSEAPLDLLKGAGVDLTSPEAIAAALERFDRTITELAELLEVEMYGDTRIKDRTFGPR